MAGTAEIRDVIDVDAIDTGSTNGKVRKTIGVDITNRSDICTDVGFVVVVGDEHHPTRTHAVRECEVRSGRPTKDQRHLAVGVRKWVADGKILITVPVHITHAFDGETAEQSVVMIGRRCQRRRIDHKTIATSLCDR